MSSTVTIPSSYTFTLGGGLTINTTPITVTSKLIGDVNQPVTARVTGDPAHPVATLVTGDASKPVATLITGDASKPVATLITGDETKPVTTTLQGNPAKPISSAIELLNLPRLTLSDIKDLQTPKIRVRLPNYNQVCFKLFGTEIFSICTGGEGQVITEPYVPNAHERCEVQCCEPDIRPFPQQPNRDGNTG